MDQDINIDEENTTIIGLGKYAVAHNPATLASLGLGSCVAVVMYDVVNKVGGLAHIMLPTITSVSSQDNKNKFADVAVQNMYDDIVKMGGAKNNIIVKLIGGAHMFKTLEKNIHSGIGESNLEAVRKKIRELDLRIIAEDTGGNLGRTAYLDLKTGAVYVKTKDYIKEI